MRSTVTETLAGIAAQCDGVRCDMAVLLLNAVFEKTWGPRAGAMPETDYWRQIVPAVRTIFPEFLFIAEAYWDLEWELQLRGKTWQLKDIFTSEIFERHGDEMRGPGMYVNLSPWGFHCLTGSPV